MTTGQLSLLRLGDLSRTVTADGRSIDILRIPRSKQRGHTPREQLKNFWLEPDVDRVLKAQRDFVSDQMQALLGNLAGSIVAELPLFPNWAFIKKCQSVQQLKRALRGDMPHSPTSNMSRALKKIRVVSVRTGRQLRITPRRFRYTVGTRAAREGYGALVIAELLDHSDTQNAQVYTRDHPNFRREIDEALGQQLAGLARTFAGTVVDRETDARHGDDRRMRVGTLEQKVGTCGSSGWCGAIPSACYTCMHFQAWVDAPHHKMLEWALDRRDELKAAGTSEMVVSAMDSSILGVRAVMDACEARQAELAGIT